MQDLLHNLLLCLLVTAVCMVGYEIRLVSKAVESIARIMRYKDTP